MKSFKKSIAVILSVLMLFSVFSVIGVSAADDEAVTYYVIGDKGLCGNDWVMADPNTVMTKTEDGSYEKVFENVPAGQYCYKVNNGTTDEQYPADENTQGLVTVSDDGATVAIVLENGDVYASIRYATAIETYVVAAFFYDNTDKVSEADLTEYADAEDDYSYKSTIGTGTLSATITGENPKHLSWSKDEYTTVDTKGIVPVFNASVSNPWSSVSPMNVAITTKVSTKGYQSLQLTFDLGATKKGPANYVVYAVAGDEKEELGEVHLTDNKTMVTSSFRVPSYFANKDEVSFVINLMNTTSVGGADIAENPTGGEIAINNIYLKGTKFSEETTPSQEETNASEPSTEKKYYVIGDGALCGNDWLMKDEATAMTKTEDGTYVKVFPKVLAGEYTYKVNDGTNNECYPPEANTRALVTVKKDGSKVTIVLEDGDVYAMIEEPSVDETEPATSTGEYVVGELKDGYKLCYAFIPPPPWMEMFYYQYGKYIFVNHHSAAESSHGFYIKKDDEKLMLSEAFDKGITDIEEIVNIILSKDIPNFNTSKIVDTEKAEGNWKDLFSEYHFPQDDNSTEPDTEPKETNTTVADTTAPTTAEPQETNTTVADTTVPTTEPKETNTTVADTTAPVVEGIAKINAVSNIADTKTAEYDIQKDKTVTITYSIKTAQMIINTQGFIRYDSNALELVSLEMPEIKNACINTELGNEIKFNFTNYSNPVDFTDSKVFVKATFNILSACNTNVALTVQELTGTDGDKDIPYVTNEKAVESFDVTTGITEPTPGETQPVTKAPKLTASSAKLNAGKTAAIKVSNLPKGAKVTYTSSKKSVATVSSSGKVTALTKGTAKITVKIKSGSKVIKTLTYNVTVKNNPAVKPAKTVTVKKGKTAVIKITGRADAVKNKYSISNKKIAKVVTTSTKTSTVKVKGLKKGTATLKITVNNKTFKINVKVK